jgi:flagellar export protein FliJ
VKKFQFRLERLLWYHRQRQKQADVQLQQAAWHRDAALAEIARIERLVQETIQLNESVGREVKPEARENAMRHLDSLGQVLTAARENLELAVGRLREAQRVHSEITQQVEGLVHLRAQQLAEYRDEIAHQQQIVIDEIVMRQWSRRDADATA